MKTLLDLPVNDLEATKAKATAYLRTDIRRALLPVYVSGLGAIQSTILTGLGIDARQTLRQIFHEEIDQLFKEE